ncbi:MAG: hypothetical protein KQ78_00324 [Candidatus Izimaplasma bacterium HR2]|nr:MAG: hypothetical protein KQ78_00324 [Candidatus Izimaplasma bacterium HR2]
MKLLKIGTLNVPRNRWLDATKIFDKIYVVCMEKEIELDNEKIVYLKMHQSSGLSQLLSKLVFRIARRFRGNKIIVKLSLMILRLTNSKIINKIKKLDFDYTHSSYNDFDESGILTLMLQPFIKHTKITRAYKENRPEKNYVEKSCFSIANRLVFNSNENKEYFLKKHKDINWDNKEIIIDLDEDYRQEEIINKVILKQKLSDNDQKNHVVILAGRVMSDAKNKRSGTRLFYIPLINELINAGLVVHLHTMRIIDDKNGVNQYEILKRENLKNFHIEGPLDFENNPIKSYEILSGYNFGILHNISDDDKYVSVFDKINIPHRFYEYQIAGVIPILKRGDTTLMERLFESEKYGVVYDSLNDLNDLKCVPDNFNKQSFLNYISKLYKN